MSLDRLIRFLDEDGQEKYGNVEREIPTGELEGSVVQLLTGNIEIGFQKQNQQAKVAKVLNSLIWWPWSTSRH